MRFLNGLLGTYAGLMIAQMVVMSLLGAHQATASLGFWLFNAVLAAITAGIIVWREKPEWNWLRYGVVGLYTTGTVLALLTIMALSVAVPQGLPGLAYVMAILPAMVAGLASGVGYRALVGTKPAAK